jgi:hypothetical protein
MDDDKMDSERIINTFRLIRSDINREYLWDNDTLEYKQMRMIKKGLDDIIENFETFEDIKNRVIKDNKREFWRQPET